MECTTLHTGNRFLGAALDALDCHGRNIGSYGYGALADPNSATANAISGILALFIAIWGIRLLAGQEPREQDLIGAILRIGLFLTLATSWPAWRVVGYNLVLDAPAQVGRAVGVAAGLPGSSGDLTARLQDADNAIVLMTMFGSGRFAGAVARNADIGDSIAGIALTDQASLGTGRSVFLISTIGTWAVARLGAGLLLALAPLMAALLLFGGTSAIFIGWLRGLAFCALASLVFQIAVGAELAMLYPWIGEVLEFRQANALTPSAPTELAVLTGAFAIAMSGILLLAIRVLFMPGHASGVREFMRIGSRPDTTGQHAEPFPTPGSSRAPDRAAVVVNSINGMVRRETLLKELLEQGSFRQHSVGKAETMAVADGSSGIARQGNRYRRTTLRASEAARRRDRS